MDFLVVDGKKVIKCIHCNGTGICRHGVFKKRQDKNYPYYYLGFYACSKCGEGVAVEATKTGFFSARYEPPQPVCVVCGGKGHTTI